MKKAKYPGGTDRYVKYEEAEEAEVYGSVIIQDYRDNEKKIFKMADWRSSWNLLERNLQ